MCVCGNSIATGATKSTNSTPIGDINVAISYQMRLELMWSYCAAVSFLDVQIGRILDTMDELNLWENTTVILTGKYHIIYYHSI